MSNSAIATTSTCLHVTWGRDDQTSVAKLVEELLLEGPRIVWCEPRPRRERLTNFRACWLGDWTSLLTHLQAPVPLDEARLFWRDGWVHLLADGRGTRWAHFHEAPEEAGNGPEWAKRLHDGAVEGQDFWRSLVRQTQDVLLLRDLHRYGLAGLGKFPEEGISVHLYRNGTRLVGWNLERDK